MINRRDFIYGASAITAYGWLGRAMAASGGKAAGEISPNYWCTWGIQNAMLKYVKRDPLAFAGDQGAAGARNNLNEEIIFGKEGWKDFFPKSRGRMYMMLDDGWDVPYGCVPGRDMSPFALMDPYPERFPSFGSTRRERLCNLNKRLVDCGWRGAGLWVACQCYGESRGKTFLTNDKARDEWRAKIEDCAAAGIGYLKVDWGARVNSVDFRRMLSELKNEIAPEMIVEHKPQFSGVLNGLKLTKDGVSGHGRLIDDVRRRITNVKGFDYQAFGFSDVIRIYDLLQPLTNPTALERIAAYSEVTDKLGTKTMLNVEDQVVLGAVLGHTFGVMRAPLKGERKGTYNCLNEVDRAIAWQAIAPACAGRKDFTTKFSEEALTDEWRFANGEGWFQPAWEKTIHQTAPAVIARGCELPEVKSMEAEKPFVCAARHPNGALSVAAVRRVKVGRVWTPKAAIDLKVRLEKGVPLAVFGEMESVSLEDATGGAKVLARDLVGGKSEDVTAAVIRKDGKIVLPGTLLGKIGTSGAAKDESSPGTLITVG